MLSAVAVYQPLSSIDSSALKSLTLRLVVKPSLSKIEQINAMLETRLICNTFSNDQGQVKSCIQEVIILDLFIYHEWIAL